MDYAVKNYADAMEKGWIKCPVMVNNRFWIGDDPRKPDACCSNGHAALGSSYANANFWYEFEKTVKHIKVNYWNKQKTSMLIVSLPHAIDILISDGWTTPQVVEWLRSHEND